MTHVHGATAYLAILATCIAGILQAPWWAACAGASLLVIVSLTAAEKYAAENADIVQYTQVASSVLNGATAAAAAYGMGHLIAWVWGL